VSPAAFRGSFQLDARVPARVEGKAVAVDRAEKLCEFPKKYNAMTALVVNHYKFYLSTL